MFDTQKTLSGESLKGRHVSHWLLAGHEKYNTKIIRGEVFLYEKNE